MLGIGGNLETVSQKKDSWNNDGEKNDGIFHQDSERRPEVTSVLIFHLMPENESRTNRTKGLHVKTNHLTDSYYANPSGAQIFAHAMPRSLWAFSRFPFLLLLKKSVSIFITLWFISFPLKSPGTLKELVGLNVSWNVWGWWELCSWEFISESVRCTSHCY